MDNRATASGRLARRFAESLAPPPPPSRRHPQPPSEQEYDFVEEPPREFFCAVSLELLQEPQQTDCCGHHLSLEVAQRLQRERKPCPVCQKPHFTTHPDVFHRRRIRQFMVRCTCKNNGCTWVGELGNLQNHVTKCPKRPWRCRYCAFNGLKEVEEGHLRGCGQFPVPCPNGCEAGSVERCSLEQHLSECLLQLVGCEYAAMGCAVRLPRREMSEHIRQSGQEHLLKMCAANLTVSRELSRKVEEKEQRITELQEEMRRMEGRVEGRMREMEKRMVEMEGRMNRNVERQLKAAIDMVTKNEHEVKEVIQQVASVHCEVLSRGHLIYYIHNFSNLKAQDKEWRSPPFYTHLGGYKGCIGVWPNGYGRYKGSHVSVMFCKMRDANTEALRWPAELPITIHLWGHSWDGRYINSCKLDHPSSEIESSIFPLFSLPHSKLAPYASNDCFGMRVISWHFHGNRV